MTNSYKKEYPFVGYAGFGGGVGALSAKSSAVSTKYVDEVFSTVPYIGDGTNSHKITNGIPLSTTGGFIWGKERGNSGSHYQFDTVRGLDKRLKSNSDAAQETDTFYSSVDSDGYTIEKTTSVNISGNTYASWTWAIKEGFCDVVTYTGNGSNRTISHSLGSIPGMIIVKRTDTTSDWMVYHRSAGGNNPGGWSYLFLNTMAGVANATSVWNDTDPTSSVFSVGTDNYVNASGGSYVAYVFAGGESDAATARSVNFDGSNDYLTIPDNDDWDIGSSDATIECWAKFDTHNGHDGIVHNFHSSGLPGNGTSGWGLEPVGGTLCVYWGTTGGSYGNVNGATIPLGQWQHMAFTKSGSTITIYQDGVKTGSGTISGTINPGVEPLQIGGNCVVEYCDCKISNLRITKGQVLYTSSFRPSTEPLTTTSQGATASNVKLLCCNDSSVTGSTVTPDTITNNNGATASIDSPFDDTAAFKFGADENKNITKCGSYDGNGSSTGPEVYLGWEPQFVILKQSSASGNQWRMYDSMRGITTGNDAELYPSSNGEEDPDNEFLELTPTGFKLKTSDSAVNGNTATYIYYCIRRPDAIVGKPATTGTSVFAMDVGNASSTIPTFDSGFPVDFGMMRNPASADPNFIGARLTGTSGNKFNADPPEASTDFGSQWAWDSIAGWVANNNYSTGTQSWMWKRGQGFDTVTWTGNGVDGRDIPHSLNAVPKMMIVKTRTDGSIGWAVYHVGLNGGVNPEQYYLQMPGNNNAAVGDNRWKSTAPTSTHFTVGDSSRVNLNGSNYLALLFGDVTGISKCGYYTGDGTSNGSHSIDVGFQPRFIIIKQNNGTNWKNYVVIDTLRGEDNIMYLNADTAQSSSDLIDISSTGWSFKSSDELVNSNENSNRYIYYAHA